MSNPSCRAPRVRQRVLAQSPDIRIALTWYPPHHAMAAHAHATLQHSILLAGRMEECHGGRTSEIDGAGTGLKPAGLVHANRYGGDGALILCIDLGEREAERLGANARDWSWHGGAPNRAELARIASACGGGDVAGFAAEIIAGGAQAAPPRDRRPPRWLSDIRERLRDAPDEVELDAEANRAGVHRVHLTRAFTRHFGMTPSLFRQRARLARATALLAEGRCGTEAAHAAGFADQSHLIRVMRRETGFTPERLRNVLAG